MNLIFGNGYIGNLVLQSLPNSVMSYARIDNTAAVFSEITKYRPDVVINCAGKTGKPNVDWCETHRQETFLSNVVGPINLANECAEQGVFLIHIGSGCIFYGESPCDGGWKETDFANPVSTYSRSKYMSDLALSTYSSVAIIRIRMPIGSSPHPRNLITKLVGYNKIIDVSNSVTIIEDLMVVVKEISSKKPSGIFHAVNPGTMRHRDLIEMYRNYVDPAQNNEWIDEPELVGSGLAQKPRSNCTLSSTRLPAIGIEMPPVLESLKRTMKLYASSFK